MGDEEPVILHNIFSGEHFKKINLSLNNFHSERNDFGIKFLTWFKNTHNELNLILNYNYFKMKFKIKLKRLYKDRIIF